MNRLARDSRFHAILILAALTAVIAAAFQFGDAFAHNSTPNVQENSLVVTSTPSATNRSGVTNVTATVQAHRIGGVSTNWSVQLALPAGYSIAAGENSQILSTSSHGMAVASWLVSVPSIPSGPDNFTVVASATDGSTGSPLSGSPETDTFAITTVNSIPVANDDSVTIFEDTLSIFSVLSNDTDFDVDSLQISSLYSPPAHGVVFLTDANTTLTYSPDADYFGTDSFEYAIADEYGGIDIGRVSVTIISVNDPPVANDDTASTLEDTKVSIETIGNDTDVDFGDVLSMVMATNASNGDIVTNSTDDSIAYIPNSNFNGIEILQYVISDGNGGTDTGTVYVSVLAVNDVPITYNASVETDQGRSKNIKLLGSDVEEDDLIFFIVQVPSHGSVSEFNSATGELSYTPETDYFGNDSIGFVVNDGITNSTAGTISITVNETDQEEIRASSRDSRDNNKREKSESELTATRLTYEESYFVDNPLRRIQIQSQHFLRADGSLFSSVPAGERISLTCSIRNYQQHDQDYSLVIQVTDNSGVATFIDFFSGEIGEAGSEVIEIGWVPETKGLHHATVMIVDDFESGLFVAETGMMEILVH